MKLEVTDKITVFRMTISKLRANIHPSLKLLLIDFIENDNLLLYVFSLADNYIVVEVNSEKRETVSISDLSPKAYIYEIELVNQYNFKIIGFTNNFNIQKHDYNNIRFEVWSDGKKINQLITYLGFNYRDIEKYMIKQSFLCIYSDIAKFFNNCTAAHVINYHHCILDLLGIDNKNKNIHSILLELQRINNHMLWIILLLIEFDFHRDIIIELSKLRTQIYNILTVELTNGIPIEEFILNPSELSEINIEEIIKSFNEIHYKLSNYDFSIFKFTSSTCINCTGVIARSKNGDIYSHLSQRLSEIDTSFKFLNSIDYTKLKINNYYLDELSLKCDKYAIRCIEAPNGELLYLIKTDSSGNICHMRIAIPSLVNLPTIITKIMNNDLKYLSMIIKLFDMGDPLDELIVNNGYERKFNSIEFRELAKEAILKGMNMQL